MLAGGGVALLVLSLALHAYTVHKDREHLWFMIDLAVYRWGGEQAALGRSVYESKYIGYLPFTYPPIAAVLFVPLNDLKFKDLRMVSQVVSIAALAWTMWASIGALGRRAVLERVALVTALTAVVLWLEPVQQTLRLGQVNLILLAVTVIDLCRPDSARTKGIGVGIAAGIKLTPAIFIVYLLVTRRTRAGVVAIGTVLATIALGFVVLPSDSWRFWAERTFADADRIGAVAYVGNQSVHGFIARLLGGPAAADPWWMLASLTIGVIGLYVAARVHETGRELHAVLLCALTGLLVSPISWSHHWVWAAPGLAAAVDAALRRRTRGRWTACAALALLAGAWFFHLRPGARLLPQGLIWLAPLAPDPTGQGTVVQDVLGNLYVLCGLGVFAWSLAAAVGQRRAGRSAAVDLAEGLREPALGEPALGRVAGRPLPQQ
jgi:alpha-1,2-mannosyltransferase